MHIDRLLKVNIRIIQFSLIDIEIHKGEVWTLWTMLKLEWVHWSNEIRKGIRNYGQYVVGSSSELLTWAINIERNINDYLEHQWACRRIKKCLESTMQQHSQLDWLFWCFERFNTKVEWEKSNMQELTLKNQKSPFNLESLKYF